MEDPVRIFRIVLFGLCIGLLGVVSVIAGLPKPAALSQRNIDYPLRPQIRDALDQAIHLAAAGDYNDGLKLVDGANAFSNKTALEVMEINQVLGFIFGKPPPPTPRFYDVAYVPKPLNKPRRYWRENH